MQIVRSGLEPFMLIGSVVDDHVHKHLYPAPVAFGDEFLIVFHGPESRVNGIVVSHIVFVIRGRRMHRGDPDLIESQILYIIQL